MSKDIVLALGGGGVRGYAHLGVLHVLQKGGFTIRAVAGTSAGAIVGSLVAAGYSYYDIQKELETIDAHRVFQRKSNDLPSILGINGLEEKLRQLLGRRSFAELEIPFAAVAVDLHAGSVAVIQEGDVVDAVMASCAVPGFFPPRQINGRTYIDGGVLLPVPVQPVRQLAPGLPVVAVALSPPLNVWGEYGEYISLLTALPVLQRFITRSRIAQSLKTFLTAVDMGSAQITDLCLERDVPEIVIRPKVYHIGLLELTRADPLVTAGEDAAFESLEQLNWITSWQSKVARRFPVFQRIYRSSKS